MNEDLKKLYVAGGCFWCTESDFQKIPGVMEVVSGYSGGHVENPTYLQVAEEGTGHREAIEIAYDPSSTDYRTLLLEFFDHIDPTDAGGQFHDRGETYTTAIFYGNEEERQIAEDLIREINESGIYDKPIATTVEPFKNFYKAEEYHQDYHSKNSVRYGAYRMASGRDQMRKKSMCDKRRERLSEIVCDK